MPVKAGLLCTSINKGVSPRKKEKIGAPNKRKIATVENWLKVILIHWGPKDGWVSILVFPMGSKLLPLQHCKFFFHCLGNINYTSGLNMIILRSCCSSVCWCICMNCLCTSWEEEESFWSPAHVVDFKLFVRVLESFVLE